MRTDIKRTSVTNSFSLELNVLRGLMIAFSFFPPIWLTHVHLDSRSARDDEEAAFVTCIVNAIGAKRLRTKSAIVAKLNRSFECGSCLQKDNLKEREKLYRLIRKRIDDLVEREKTEGMNPELRESINVANSLLREIRLEGVNEKSVEELKEDLFGPWLEKKKKEIEEESET
jgi:hypothetical protein